MHTVTEIVTISGVTVARGQPDEEKIKVRIRNKAPNWEAGVELVFDSLHDYMAFVRSAQTLAEELARNPNALYVVLVNSENVLTALNAKPTS